MSYELTENLTKFTDAALVRMATQDEKIAGLDSAITELAQKSDSGFASVRSSGKTELKNIGNDVGVKSFASDRSQKSVNVNLDLGLKTLVKAVTGDGAGAESYDVAPQRSPILARNPQRRLTAFDVLPRLQVSSNAFEFNRLNAYTNAAAYQATEGATKAAGTMPTALESVPITTIAHYIKLSEQVLADAPALQQQVSNLLGYGVLAKASAEILAGATAGKIQGLATQATPFVAVAGTKLADAIGQAATALDVQGWSADTVFVHPSDWFAIRSERTATEGDYVAGGWAGLSGPSIWGMSVVADPSIAIGSPLVLDSSQVAILDRMETRVEFGRSGDDMVNNLITALGECRVGLAVFAPSAVAKVTITP